MSHKWRHVHCLVDKFFTFCGSHVNKLNLLLWLTRMILIEPWSMHKVKKIWICEWIKTQRGWWFIRNHKTMLCKKCKEIIVMHCLLLIHASHNLRKYFIKNLNICCALLSKLAYESCIIIKLSLSLSLSCNLQNMPLGLAEKLITFVITRPNPLLILSIINALNAVVVVCQIMKTKIKTRDQIVNDLLSMSCVPYGSFMFTWAHTLICKWHFHSFKNIIS